MSKSYDWQSCYNEGTNSARVVMQKMHNAQHICHYQEKTDGVSQAKQRDFLVWFENQDEVPAHVEVKSERWQFVNLAIELVHDIDKGTPGKHMAFDNDFYLHYMIPDNVAVRFDCHPLRDNLLKGLVARSDEYLPAHKTSFTHDGMKFKLVYPRTYKTGVYSHTSCTLVAPKELVQEWTDSWNVYDLTV